jgi:hypothetical protein
VKKKLRATIIIIIIIAGFRNFFYVVRHLDWYSRLGVGSMGQHLITRQKTHMLKNPDVQPTGIKIYLRSSTFKNRQGSVSEPSQPFGSQGTAGTFASLWDILGFNYITKLEVSDTVHLCSMYERKPT